MWMLKLIYLTFIIIFAYANQPEGTPCTTSKEERGICTNIKNCDTMMTLLRTQSQNFETMAYIQSATCSFIGSTTVVCCPQKIPTFNVTNHSSGSDTTNRNSASDNTNHSSGFGTDKIEDGVTTKKSNDEWKSTGSITGSVEHENSSLAQLLSKPQCGLSNKAHGRIVGGMPAVLDQFPFIVALGYRNEKNTELPKWLCGGTLISDRHILTAAHCVHNRKDLYLVRLGELDLYSNDEGAEPEDIKIASFRIHENYNPAPHQRTNDIAILTLEKKFTSSRVWPICLPHEEPFRSSSFLGSLLVVAGWGAIEFKGARSSFLRMTEVPVLHQDYCNRSLGTEGIIDDNVICAGYVDGTKKDNCEGDSGGPLMYSVGEGTVLRYYQIGVVSYGFKCAEPGYPGVYTRVTSFIDWIRRNID